MIHDACVNILACCKTLCDDLARLKMRSVQLRLVCTLRAIRVSRRGHTRQLHQADAILDHQRLPQFVCGQRLQADRRNIEQLQGTYDRLNVG